MTNLFDKIIKKTCTIIMDESDLTTALKAMEAHKLNRKLEIATCSKVKPSAHECCVTFKSTFAKWEKVGHDLKAKCKSKVFTEVTDQFGKIHYIELA